MSPPWRALFFLLQILNFCTSISTQVQFPCKPPHYNSYPFCNTSLSIKERAHSLVSLLTLQEKIQQLTNNASSIPRLGIPAYEWWSESLHGIATNGPGINFNGTIPSATNFPQVLGTAAAFNRTLWFLIGSAIAIEARAMYNTGQAGLTFWAPNVNIFRDPRWGRGQETPGEDPMVASAFGIEFVRGFQGGNWKRSGGGGIEFGEKRVLSGKGQSDDDDDDELMLSACCKHFTAYDLENWKNFSRYSFNAVVTAQDMEDTFQPPFHSCIQQGKASCLMCSYNAVNGVPACASKDLLQEARNEWGFKGYITSDCDAVATIVEYQYYAKTPEDAVADVLEAGLDINCGTYMLLNTKSAIEMGKVKEEEIDRALVNLFSVQLRLGLFDGDPSKGKFGKLGPQDVCTAKHKALALEAARQGIVLLKNDNKFLPLDKNDVSSLAIIGPLAISASDLGGGYTGLPCNPETLFKGLQAYVEETSYAVGCPDVSCDSDALFEEAIQSAKQAAFVIVVAGLDLSQETEDHDRVSLLLPGKQMDLVTSVATASKRPVILVLTGGGPLDVSFAERDPRIASILWIGYPGETGSKALSEVIFGDYNPGGRLPVTWYPESFTSVPMNDMNMRADHSRGYPGRTYRFYTGDRVYGFGQGLSYTNFTYRFLSAPNRLSIPASLTASYGKNTLHQKVDYVHTDELTSCNSLKFLVKISVLNVGDVDGSHVVMLFSRGPRIFNSTPQKQLIGFDRVHTKSYGFTETSILVDPCKDLSFSNEYGKRILPLGDHILMLGDLEHFVSFQTY
ncbi:Glyco_hydro_3 domain-containing protein/Glyco_hydro_3_C domain-containing protein [Cephalotus follicularis]|uniref:Glyco_hydro_3 domain-containing protein/Glyco_hydro_3_C domain-containing protein n=1 Tax=Cephalotus follicularis TaxID=3775 RepID=A0A1Q3C8N6_CEPFO|nr:Glyco_hydro_3 domain-containing protein/Glyco_hydro_3_C domain-containing protein [Cephalotus follicularis]